jgi:hypothetical protein
MPAEPARAAPHSVQRAPPLNVQNDKRGLNAFDQQILNQANTFGRDRATRRGLTRNKPRGRTCDSIHRRAQVTKRRGFAKWHLCGRERLCFAADAYHPPQRRANGPSRALAATARLVGQEVFDQPREFRRLFHFGHVTAILDDGELRARNGALIEFAALEWRNRVLASPHQ